MEENERNSDICEERVHFFHGPGFLAEYASKRSRLCSPP